MKQRIVYLDLIKIISAYLVIFTHTGNMGSKLYAYGNYDLWQDTFYMMADVFRTINVPLFFMVSGALLLGKDENYTQLFKKHIAKYMIITVVFSYFYYVVYGKNNWIDVEGFMKGIWNGSIIGLFWFFYAYLGYLIILPFMRKMIRNMTGADYIYLLVLGILFKGPLDAAGAILFEGTLGIPCYLVTDSIFYPIMGYYMANVVVEKNKRRYLAGGAILTLINVSCAVAMTYWEMNKEGIVNGSGQYTEKYLFAFTVIPTIYVFYLLKVLGTKLGKYASIGKIINCLGDCSLGVYVFGLFLQVKLDKIYWNTVSRFSEYPLMVCLFYVGVVVLTAVIVTYVLKKIPIVKRLL